MDGSGMAAWSFGVVYYHRHEQGFLCSLITSLRAIAQAQQGYWGKWDMLSEMHASTAFHNGVTQNKILWEPRYKSNSETRQLN